MLLPIAAVALLCSCAVTPVPGSLSPQSGRRDAQRDFAAGHPKIFLAGGRAAFEAGITDRDKALVAKLPRDGSLSGCTNPNGEYAVGYATAYNREVIALLRKTHVR